MWGVAQWTVLTREAGSPKLDSQHILSMASLSFHTGEVEAGASEVKSQPDPCDTLSQGQKKAVRFRRSWSVGGLGWCVVLPSPALSLSLGWMHRSGQASGRVLALRNRYSSADPSNCHEPDPEARASQGKAFAGRRLPTSVSPPPNAFCVLQLLSESQGHMAHLVNSVSDVLEVLQRERGLGRPRVKADLQRAPSRGARPRGCANGG